MMTYLNIKSLYLLYIFGAAVHAGYKKKISGVSVQSLSGVFKRVPREDKRLAGLSPAHLRFSAQGIRPAKDLFAESLLLRI